MSNFKSINISVKIDGRQLMSPMKVGLKSTNCYKSVMIIEKNYLMVLETFLSVVIAMHLSPTRSD
jgi:hypothetical protein